MLFEATNSVGLYTANPGNTCSLSSRAGLWRHQETDNGEVPGIRANASGGWGLVRGTQSWGSVSSLSKQVTSEQSVEEGVEGRALGSAGREMQVEGPVRKGISGLIPGLAQQVKDPVLL